MKILIVEDEALIAMSYQMAFKRNADAITDIALNVNDATQKVQTMHPDIILMDIQLNSEITGIQLVQEIKNKQNIPVIYITGNTDTRTKESALATQPLGYLQKPVDTETLYTTIKELLA